MHAQPSTTHYTYNPLHLLTTTLAIHYTCSLLHLLSTTLAIHYTGYPLHLLPHIRYLLSSIRTVHYSYNVAITFASLTNVVLLFATLVHYCANAILLCVNYINVLFTTAASCFRFISFAFTYVFNYNTYYYRCASRSALIHLHPVAATPFTLRIPTTVICPPRDCTLSLLNILTMDTTEEYT